MKTMVISSSLGRNNFSFYLWEAERAERMLLFDSFSDAIRYVSHGTIDLAILDMHMPNDVRAALELQLKSSYPNLLLVYVNAPEKSVLDTLKQWAASYPLFSSHASEPTSRLMPERRKNKAYAKTFGYFDLFVDGKPIMFRSAKAKELLALLIDRQGGTVTTEQAISVLWEDRLSDNATQNLYSKVAKNLQTELNNHGVGDILIRSRSSRSIDASKVDCDMYDLLNGCQRAADHFLGDYMLNYSWAEDHMQLLWQKQAAAMHRKG